MLSSMSDPGYPMRLVAKRTGLTAHVIRAWERRYAAVTPARTDTNRRLYTDHDIERLSLLRLATNAGHSISQIARLPTEQLRELIPAESVRRSDIEGRRSGSGKPEDFLEESVQAVQDMDGEGLEKVLMRASVALSLPVLVEELVAPMLHRVGELWKAGKVRAANEHLASAVVRTLLGNIKESYRVSEQAPRLVATTPSAQWHELGALIATVTAAAEGWRALYLGANLPAHEIAAAANDNRAKAVALSIVYPPDDPHLGNELKQLRRFLSPEIVLLVGGRAAPNYATDLQEVGAHLIQDTASLRAALERIRSSAPTD